MTNDHIEQMPEWMLRAVRSLLWLVVVGVFAWLMNANIVPFGKWRITYQVARGSRQVTQFASKEKDRILGVPNKPGRGEPFQLISMEPLYFDVSVPRPFEKADVTMRYQNPDNQPVIRIGTRQAGDGYAFEDMAFAEPLLDNLPDTWDRVVEGGYVVWQKNNALIKVRQAREKAIHDDLASADRQLAEELAAISKQRKDGAISRTAFDDRSKGLHDAYDRTVARIRSGLALQKRPEPAYPTLSAFRQSPPDPSVTLTYNTSLLETTNVKNYKPSSTELVLDHAIRGSHTLLTYVGSNEPLKFSFTLQNINRHTGKDSFTVEVWDSQKKLFEKKLAPLGSVRSTGHPSSEQTLVLERALPEGTYKIVLATNDDVFIKRISTQQHLVMFEKSIYLAESKEYAPLFGEDGFAPTTLFAQGTQIAAQTSHSTGLQIMNVGNGRLVLDSLHKKVSLQGLRGTTEIVVPVSDALLTNDGYFAFSQEQLFTPPAPYPTWDASVNLDKFDFIYAHYPHPTVQGGWLEAHATLNAPILTTQNNIVHFAIQMPGLPEHQRNLKVQSITIEFQKPPLTPALLWSKLKSRIAKL